MNPEAIIKIINERINRLSKKNSELVLLGKEFADSQRLYKKEKAKKIFMLRNEKVPTTVIRDLSVGDKTIADLRFKRDLAKVKYEACKSEIINLRVEIEINRSIFAWLKEELKSY